MIGYLQETHKSPAVMLCFAMNGFWMATISSRPMLGWKAVSISPKVMIEPSAPFPLDDKSNQQTLCVVWRKTYPNWP